MFILHNVTTSENLLAHLIETFENQPSPVFAQECFLVANSGIERWLSQQFAQHFSVFAHYQFLLPEPFFRQLARKIDTHLHNPEFEPELMLWRIDGLLREIDNEIFSPLKHYLQGENNAVKRYQLAAQLAHLFQNYQLLRPDLLAAWQENECKTENPAESWQQALWQKIIAQINKPHQGQLWQQAIDKLNQSPKNTFKYQLPHRLFIVGLNHFPPVWLQFLQALAVHCEVHFYGVNNVLYENSKTFPLHPLLASLGKQRLELEKYLSGFTQNNQPIKSTNIKPPTTVLQHLQRDLSQSQIQQVSKNSQIHPDDNSISIHACHSRMREVEVLKNQLLATLEQCHDLLLREIVVIAPNIQNYAPFITAVFKNDIPHHIVGHSLTKSCNATLDAFIRFLKLCESRFGWQAVLDLIEQPSIYPNFDLIETDLELIKYWLSDTHIRWGKSAEHKLQLNLPPLSENTWQQSLERLLMGYAVGENDYFVDKILPYKNIEGSSAQALGGLYAFMELLFNANENLTVAKTLDVWSQELYHCADLLFAQTKPSERQILNNLLTDFVEKFTTVHQYPVELNVIIDWLEQAMTEQKSTQGLLRGQLTFCSMNAVQGIPFQVIAILGMNDGDFPRMDKYPTFDLVATNPRLGDFSQRADDRQQFLDILLSARQQLIITYIGQSLAQNQPIPPSVVVSELLEVLAFEYQLQDVVIKQPLQPFSLCYFNHENSKLFSYSKADYETALALATVKPEVKIWWQGAINTETENLLEIADMFAFYRHPQRYFLRRQLDLRLETLQAEPEEREPFELDNLENYAINHDWIEALLMGNNFSLAKLQAQGCWLSGVMGELEFTQRQTQIAEFVQSILSLNLGEKLADLAIDLNFSTYRLRGKLSNRYENGSLFYRFATLKGKDLLITLLHHAFMNQLTEHTTYLLSVDDSLILTPDLVTTELLPTLINLYLKGQQQPNALFTESVLAYVKQAYSLQNSTRAEKPALDVATDKLRLALEQTYEPELKRLYGATQELTDLLGDEFVDFCEKLILPIWKATQ